MAIYHAYTQTVADGTATSVVRPSDWNSGHVQGFFLAGNTGGTSSVTGTDVYFSGGNGVTLSGSNNSIGIYVNTAPDQISIVGNTAGTGATFTGDNFYFMGGNNVTLSNSASSVRFDAAMNFSAANGSGSASQLVFNNANGVSFSTGAGGISASVAGGGGATLGFYEPAYIASTQTQSINGTTGSAYVSPFIVGYPVSAHALVMAIAGSNANGSSTFSISGSVSAGNATSASNSVGLTHRAYLLSRVDTGANSTRLVTFASATGSQTLGFYHSVSWSTNASSATVSVSTSWEFGYLQNMDTTGGITSGSLTSSGSTSFSSTSTNANSFSSSFSNGFLVAALSGVRPLQLPLQTTLQAGEYWIGVNRISTTGSTNQNMQTLMTYPVNSMGTYAVQGINASVNGMYSYGNTIVQARDMFRSFHGTIASSVFSTTMAHSQFNFGSNFYPIFNMRAGSV